MQLTSIDSIVLPGAVYNTSVPSPSDSGRSRQSRQMQYGDLSLNSIVEDSNSYSNPYGKQVAASDFIGE